MLDALNIRRYVLGDNTPNAIAASSPRAKATTSRVKRGRVHVRRKHR
jgi:hypothetical protein